MIFDYISLVNATEWITVDLVQLLILGPWSISAPGCHSMFWSSTQTPTPAARCHSKASCSARCRESRQSPTAEQCRNPWGRGSDGSDGTRNRWSQMIPVDLMWFASSVAHHVLEQKLMDYVDRVALSCSTLSDIWEGRSAHGKKHVHRFMDCSDLCHFHSTFGCIGIVHIIEPPIKSMPMPSMPPEPNFETCGDQTQQLIARRNPDDPHGSSMPTYPLQLCFNCFFVQSLR